MELNKCPNCSGKLELAKNRSKMVCPYCGSEFSLDEATQKHIDANPIAKDWFVYDWDYKKLMDNPSCRESITAFIRTLNDYDSAEKIEEYMRNYLMSASDVSAWGINEANMTGIADRLYSHMLPGERIILYYDDGIFAHGKTGIVVTDKRTFFVEKKTHREIMHVNIPYILFGYSVGTVEVKLGEKYLNNIGSFAARYDLQGAVAALICSLGFEQKPDRPKIRLTGS
ncbi:MAG: hypothetical protein J6Z43_10335 [Clostridiales bacterium]|nr:hypothetical protein [Clostridiales bacterium]